MYGRTVVIDIFPWKRNFCPIPIWDIEEIRLHFLEFIATQVRQKTDFKIRKF